MIKLKIFLGKTLFTLIQKEKEIKMFLLILKVVKAYARNQSLLTILGALEILLELIIQ